MHDWLTTPPHAKIPCMRCGWMSAKYSVLGLSTGKICLTCLMENKAQYSLLLMCLKWYFHVRCSSSKINKKLVDFSFNCEPIPCNLVLFISIFSPVKSQWQCSARIIMYFVFVELIGSVQSVHLQYLYYRVLIQCMPNIHV